jgi:hypothetical protein
MKPELAGSRLGDLQIQGPLLYRKGCSRIPDIGSQADDAAMRSTATEISAGHVIAMN